MFIINLQLKNFRNYEDETVDFDPGVNILTGNNGEGKTNLIEGIYLLSMGRSFRTNVDAQMIRFGQDAFSVYGEFEKDSDALKVEVRMANRKKSYFVDGGERQKSADLLDHVYTVIFSPDDLRIVSDDPEKRRRFMDRELFQIKPLYYLDVVKYRRILRNRNLLLKEDDLNEDLLGIYDGYLADTGARIMSERARFCERLNEMSRSIQSRITGGREQLEVSYDPNIPVAPAPGDQRAVILEALGEKRAKDRESGTTSSGPHKDDLKLVSEGIDLRAYGSRGQQRTAALALKLAELEIIKKETGEEAILLLDDVLSELDEDRQRFLISSFNAHQIILTSAEISEETIKQFPPAKILEVSGGRIKS
jgi:DNA replication and repair protein RecF